MSTKLHSRLALLLIIVGLAILAYAGVAFIRSNLRPAEPGGFSITGAPSAVKPSAQAVAGFTVKSDSPKYIAIPGIGVPTSRVIELGLLKSGQIATPNNVYDTGWFNGSAKPGTPGATFIYGHVSSYRAEGVFYNLKKMKPGQRVTVTRGDGSTFTYEMVSAKIYAYDDVDLDAVLKPIDGQQGLNLMTCTGQVIKGTHEFNQRLVVFTKLVDSHIVPTQSVTAPSQGQPTTKQPTTKQQLEQQLRALRP